jgi:predicted amidohydrolase
MPSLGPKAGSLFKGCREGRLQLVISAINLAEVLIHTADWARPTGGDPGTLLSAAALLNQLRVVEPSSAASMRWFAKRR